MAPKNEAEKDADNLIIINEESAPPQTLWPYGFRPPDCLTVEEKALRNGLVRLYDKELEFHFRVTTDQLLELLPDEPDNPVDRNTLDGISVIVGRRPEDGWPVAISMFVEDHSLECILCMQRFCKDRRLQLFVVAKEFAYQSDYLEYAAMIGDGDISLNDWMSGFPNAFCPVCGSYLVLKYYGKKWGGRQKVFFACSAFLDRWADGVYCKGFTCAINEVDKYFAEDRRKSAQLKLQAMSHAAREQLSRSRAK